MHIFWYIFQRGEVSPRGMCLWGRGYWNWEKINLEIGIFLSSWRKWKSMHAERNFSDLFWKETKKQTLLKICWRSWETGLSKTMCILKTLLGIEFAGVYGEINQNIFSSNPHPVWDRGRGWGPTPCPRQCIHYTVITYL